MSAAGKRSVLGVLVDIVDYDEAAELLLDAARQRNRFAGTALAVHGVVTASRDAELLTRVNELDLVTPDGQPVRWALNRLHGAQLTDRVYGPELMQRVLAACAAERLPVFLYGSRPEVLGELRRRLIKRFPGLEIAGTQPSRFTSVSDAELSGIASDITASGARIVFAGLGCPRQEVFVHSIRRHLDVPVFAVGAAFDFHAGTARQAPSWMQARGLEWLFRLIQEPRRLWRRYVLLNPYYVFALALQRFGLHRPRVRAVHMRDVTPA